METFTAPKELVDNPHYKEQRLKSLASLTGVTIDAPLIDIIAPMNKLPYCFTIQSCYGHFLYAGQTKLEDLEPLPVTASLDRVEYRIAYIAFCIENNAAGQRLLQALREITWIDPDNIQFGSVEWFWKRQVNSYALQVEPGRFKHKDRVSLEYREAVHIEKVRNEVFSQMAALLGNLRPCSPMPY